MLKFPFEKLRKGQEEIIKEVRESIKGHENLMIQAPTGFGKTVAVLFAALNETMPDKKKVLLLTSRHTHQKIVYDTIERISKNSSTKIKYMGINGKSTMCLFENAVEGSIFNEFCRTVKERGMCRFYERTYFQGKPSSIASMAMRAGISRPEEAMEAGRLYTLCPYELSIIGARNSDVIVANYSHVFNPSIFPSFSSKTGIDPENTVLIVDEAHNLPSRITEMNSISLSIKTIEKAYEEVAIYNQELARKLKTIISYAKKSGEEKKINLKEIFDADDEMIVDEIIKRNESTVNVPYSLYLKNFINKAIEADDSYIEYITNENGRSRIHIDSLDPSKYSAEILNDFSSSILISGTLKPMEMFSNILGIPDCKKLSVENHFPAENRYIINDVSATSKFSSRGEFSIKIAEKLEEIKNNFEYGSVVFFPSYEFMSSVVSKIKDRSGLLIEEQNMSREKQAELLSKLNSQRNMLFAVIGGSFSESIDLNNKAVKLIVIVGVPFEPPSLKLKALQEYYQKKFGNGFEYAQVLPAMIKTMQAAGRAIRSEKDRAVIVLMDYRFQSGLLRKYLPEDIKVTDENLLEEIKSFRLA
mgnify:CR=1 FL=1